MKILMTGSSGLIGTALTGALEARGDEVIRLVRRPARSGGELSWDPHAERGGVDPAALAGVGAAVNLAGEPVAGGRWTTARKQRILDSRRSTTRALSGLLTALDTPPAVLLSGSAMGFYGDTGGREADESSPSGSGFLPDVVRQWEAAAGPVAGGRDPGRVPAHGAGDVGAGRAARAAAAAVPGRARRPDRSGHAVDELDHAGRLGADRLLPAGQAGAFRAGEPDRAEPLHQRRVHVRAGGGGWPAGPAWRCPRWRCGWGSARSAASCCRARGWCRGGCWTPASRACGRPAPRSGPRWRPSSAPARDPGGATMPRNPVIAVPYHLDEHLPGRV